MEVVRETGRREGDISITWVIVLVVTWGGVEVG